MTKLEQKFYDKLPVGMLPALAESYLVKDLAALCLAEIKEAISQCSSYTGEHLKGQTEFYLKSKGYE